MNKHFFGGNVKKYDRNFRFWTINPLTSTREGVTVFTSPYLSAGAPALGEAKGLNKKIYIYLENIFRLGDYFELHDIFIIILYNKFSAPLKLNKLKYFL